MFLLKSQPESGGLKSTGRKESHMTYGIALVYK